MITLFTLSLMAPLRTFVRYDFILNLLILRTYPTNKAYTQPIANKHYHQISRNK